MILAFHFCPKKKRKNFRFHVEKKNVKMALKPQSIISSMNEASNQNTYQRKVSQDRFTPNRIVSMLLFALHYVRYEIRYDVR